MSTTATVEERVVRLRLADVAPHPHNERDLSASDEGIKQLAVSISASGVLEPVVVSPVPDGLQLEPEWQDRSYVLVFGHRRWLASSVAGLDDMPCIVRELDATTIFFQQIAENEERRDLTAMQECRKIGRLTKPVAEGGYGLSQRDVARRLARGQSWVSKRLALARLPLDVQEQVDDGRLSKASAYELAKLADHPHLVRDALVEARGLDELGFRAAVDRALEQLGEEAVPDPSRGGRPRQVPPPDAQASATVEERPSQRPRRQSPVPLAQREQVGTKVTLSGEDYRWLKGLVGTMRVRQVLSAAAADWIAQQRAQQAADAESAG